MKPTLAVLDRRTVLRGGGVALALPFLDAMTPRRARAQGSKKAKRLLTSWTPNGNVMSAWTPTGSETDFKFGRVLAPLEAFKKDMIVLSGVDTMVSSPAPCGHYPPTISALTGQPTPAGSVFMGQGWAPGISVDQHIGNQVGKTTKLKTLEMGVGIPAMKSGMDTLSYSAANMPLPVQCNPADVFQRLFGDAVVSGADPAVAARLRNDKKTVLDAVLAQFKALGGRVAAQDRQRLDAHAQQIRDIEGRLTALDATPAGATSACGKVAAPVANKPTGSFAAFPAVAKVQLDLVAAAFACDLTRVITFQWANSTSGQVFSWVNVNTGHHGLSHATDGASIEKLTAINVWYMEQLAYLAGKLKAIPDGAGTVLDSTVIYSTNELTNGAAHSHNDSPLLLLGGAGGFFKTGRFLRYAGTTPHNNVLVSLCNAMGLPDTSFGKKEWCTGPLSGLTT